MVKAREKAKKQTDQTFGEISDEMIESSKSLRKTLNIVSIILSLVFVMFIIYLFQ